jgi:hypothetical protein
VFNKCFGVLRVTEVRKGEGSGEEEREGERWRSSDHVSSGASEPVARTRISVTAQQVSRA